MSKQFQSLGIESKKLIGRLEIKQGRMTEEIINQENTINSIKSFIENLTQTLTLTLLEKQNKTIIEMQDEIKVLKTISIQIGFLYTQLRNQSSPIELWLKLIEVKPLNNIPDCFSGLKAEVLNHLVEHNQLIIPEYLKSRNRVIIPQVVMVHRTTTKSMLKKVGQHMWMVAMD